MKIRAPADDTTVNPLLKQLRQTPPVTVLFDTFRNPCLAASQPLLTTYNQPVVTDEVLASIENDINILSELETGCLTDAVLEAAPDEEVFDIPTDSSVEGGDMVMNISDESDDKENIEKLFVDSDDEMKDVKLVSQDKDDEIFPFPAEKKDNLQPYFSFESSYKGRVFWEEGKRARYSWMDCPVPVIDTLDQHLRKFLHKVIGKAYLIAVESSKNSSNSISNKKRATNVTIISCSPTNVFVTQF